VGSGGVEIDDGNAVGDRETIGDGGVIVGCDVVADAEVDMLAGGDGLEVTCSSGIGVSVLCRLLDSMMPSQTRLSDIAAFA